ncbi:MAG: Calx-beta domain-containing protein [Verrucomicrobiota bacterium]
MIPPKRTLLGVATLALAGVAVAATASAGRMTPAAPPAKPVIGAPTAVPAKPQAAKPFTVSFKVTSSTTHRVLTTGLMASTTSAGGKAIAHKQSFKGGTARVSLVVPAIASGKALRVTVTIRSGGQSATRTVAYPVPALPKPSVAINGASAPEGNGTTTLSFPVALSASTPLPVSVSYATSNGSATAPADFTSATGTVKFAPGETSKTITVTVVGDTAYEPDETFTVALSNPVNATIGTGSATGTIQNDDPVAQPGHYAGTNSQNEAWAFDVTPDGRGLTNLTSGQVNMQCSYAGQTIAHLAGGNIHLTGTIPVAMNGSFSATVNFTGGTIAGYPITSDVLTVAGQFTNNTASGTFNEKLSFNLDVYQIDCITGDQTWTATRTG